MKTPLDTTKWQQNPCSLVPQATLTQLGVTTQGQPGSGRPACNWTFITASNGGALTVQFVTDSPTGLSAVYAGRSQTSLFKPSMIDGYPAVTYRRPPEGKNNCGVGVGVTDKLYYEADAGGFTNGDACQAALTLATAAMTTMKSTG